MPATMAVVTQAPNGNVRLSRRLSPTYCGGTGFPGGPAGKNPQAAQERQEARVGSSGREGPLEQDAAATPVFLPGESHGRRSLVGYSPWGHRESDRTEAT